MSRGKWQFRLTMMGVAAFCFCLVTLRDYYDYIDLCCDWIMDGLRSWNGCNELLCRLAQSGIISYDGQMIFGLRIVDRVVLLPETQNQLLMALRELLYRSLSLMLISGCGMWPVLNGLLSAAVFDGVRAHRSMLRDLPRFGTWQLPAGLRQILCFAVLILCIPDWGASDTIGILMLMLRGVLNAVCCVYGTAALCGMIGRRSRALAALGTVIGIILSCTLINLMPLLVMTDMLFDLRGLQKGSKRA